MRLLPYLMENTGVCEEEGEEGGGGRRRRRRSAIGGRLEAKPIIQGAFDGEERGSFLFYFLFRFALLRCLVV